MLSATRVHWAELLYIQHTHTHALNPNRYEICLLHVVLVRRPSSSPCAPSDLALIRADLPAALILFSCQLFTAHDRFYILRVQCFVL